jgi:hypothetical protein
MIRLHAATLAKRETVMRDLIVVSTTAEKRKAAAACLGTAEFLQLAALVERHASGDDLTETLQQLVAIQELKKRNGLQPNDMLNALNSTNAQALRSVVREGNRDRFLAGNVRSHSRGH